MEEGDSYVLDGREDSELDRLRFQHDVWRDVVEAALDDAGFGPGQVVADLGCGPGFLAMDLARRVAPGGRVLAVDYSEPFIRNLKERASRDGLDAIEARVGNIMEPVAEPGALDGAVYRWVLMFLSDPASAIANVVDALRPGGRLVAMEYFQFRSIALHPSGPAFARTYDAVHRLITSAGGDPDIGERLPRMFRDAGLEVTGLRPALKVGRPGSAEWQWLEGTHRNHPGLVEAGLLTADELEAFYREWERARSDEGAFFSGPPVVVVTGRKPG